MFDRGLRRFQLQVDLQALLLADFETNFGDSGTETLRRDADVIVAGRQLVQNEAAGAVGSGSAFDRGGFAGGRHFRANNGCSGRIGDIAAKDRGTEVLPQRRHRA